MDQKYKELISQEFLNCLINTVKRLQKRGLYKEANNNPFQEFLLPKDAIFWSRFERSFSTSFGQRVIEVVSKYLALATGADEAATQRKVSYKISAKCLNSIDYHIQSLRSNRINRKPNWEEDLKSIEKNDENAINETGEGIFDLWFSRNGQDNYFSIKTVKPNIDQTAVAKADLMKVKSAYPSCNAYFGLYYNPYGDDRALYNFNPPFKIFDMHADPVVLIGKDYWETIGGEGAYQEILDIAESVSIQAKKIIDEYLSYL